MAVLGIICSLTRAHITIRTIIHIRVTVLTCCFYLVKSCVFECDYVMTSSCYTDQIVSFITEATAARLSNIHTAAVRADYRSTSATFTPSTSILLRSNKCIQ